MKKNHNRLWIVTFVCLCLCLTSTISAMQMGGFDIDVGNGENSSWQWHEEQQWNQSSWENTWENNRQTGDNTSETPVHNDQAKFLFMFPVFCLAIGFRIIDLPVTFSPFLYIRKCFITGTDAVYSK